MQVKKAVFDTLQNSLLWVCAILMALTACSEKMAPASVTGYNHSKIHPIYYFTVNGAMGSNINEESGAGESCCVSIPETWRPGLKATIAWHYGTAQTDPNPPPPSQEIVIEIPEYKKPGKFQVHFYDHHKIKVVISGCGIGHPFYPMNVKDKLPWEDSFTKEAAIESHKNGGTDVDC